MNPGSPAPQASVLILNSRENHSDSGIHSRPRARINGRFAKEISIVPPKTEEGIINTLITLRGNGITDGVLETISQKLKQIARNCDITDPNAVKQYIATAKNQKTGKPLAQGTKNKFLYAYDKYCDVHQIEWIKPYYKEVENVPLIPTTDNVNAIISNASEHYATIFRILAETGAEGHELENIARSDIDTEQGIISIKGCKGHSSGAYKLKSQTAEMLRVYLHHNPQEHPFPKSEQMSDVWRNTRRRTATKLCKPELDNIQMRNLRNYSGAQLYYKTRDPIAVMRHLRHKKLETTMHYIRGITTGGEEEYTCKATNNTKEAQDLIEHGFTYVTTTPEALMLFRKRK